MQIEQTPSDEEWLVKQLRAWPERVDMGKTTSITYLMQSAADEIDRLAALSARPAVDDDMVERVAIAIAKAWYGPDFDPFSAPEYYDMAEQCARAAIAAMGSDMGKGGL